MLMPIRNAALLATLAVVGVALFPVGAGSFTATHGPLTAVSVVGHTILEFILICILPAVMVTHIQSCRLRQVGVLLPVSPDRTPIPALRR